MSKACAKIINVKCIQRPFLHFVKKMFFLYKIRRGKGGEMMSLFNQTTFKLSNPRKSIKRISKNDFPTRRLGPKF